MYARRDHGTWYAQADETVTFRIWLEMGPHLKALPLSLTVRGSDFSCPLGSVLGSFGFMPLRLTATEAVTPTRESALAAPAGPVGR
jgi:hypothetical protein